MMKTCGDCGRSKKRQRVRRCYLLNKEVYDTQNACGNHKKATKCHDCYDNEATDDLIGRGKDQCRYLYGCD